jgi:AAA domain
MSDWEEPEPGTDPRARVEELRGWLHGAADLSRIPPPAPVIEGWFDLDSLAWIVGQAGHGKSFVALDAAGCVANGVPWHGCATKRANAIYIVLEGAPGIHQRVRAWEDFYGMEMGVTFLVPRKFHIVRDATPLGMLAAELQAALVIIDTQNRATVGLDENSNVDMGLMIASLDEVREQCGACVGIVHHTSTEGRRPRGHSSIDAAASTLIRVARDGALVKVENTKQKDHGQSRSLALAATERAGGLVLAQDGADLAVADSERKVWSALKDVVAVKGGATHTELKQAVTSVGMPVRTFNWALRRLYDRKLITRSGNTYRLTDPVQGQLM